MGVGKARVAIGFAGFAAALLITAGPAAADHAYGAGIVLCGQVTEFVPPTATADGRITIRGAGPGYREIREGGDTHTFPFRAGTSLDAGLESDLKRLADGDRYSCLRLEAGGPADEPPYITRLRFDRTAQFCGTLERGSDGVFGMTDQEDTSRETRWLGDARSLIDGAAHLRLLMTSAVDATVCIDMAFSERGGLQSLDLSGTWSVCGPVAESSPLRIGEVRISPDGSGGSDQLLAGKAIEALVLIARTGGTACATLVVTADRLASVEIGAAARLCGYVRDGGTTIDRVAVPSGLLRDDQRDSLMTATDGGTACLDVQVSGRQVGVELAVIAAPTPVPTSTPTPSPSPTATRQETPSPTPTPTPTPSPVAAGPLDANDAGASTGGPVLPFLLVLVALTGVATTIGVYYYRRRAAAGMLIPAASAAGSDTAWPEAWPTSVEDLNLTPREREVLAMLALGRTNREIGQALFISESTAGVHVSNILGKLSASSRAEAAAIAVRLGMGDVQAQPPLQH